MSCENKIRVGGLPEMSAQLLIEIEMNERLLPVSRKRLVDVCNWVTFAKVPAIVSSASRSPSDQGQDCVGGVAGTVLTTDRVAKCHGSAYYA